MPKTKKTPAKKTAAKSTADKSGGIFISMKILEPYIKYWMMNQFGIGGEDEDDVEDEFSQANENIVLSPSFKLHILQVIQRKINDELVDTDFELHGYSTQDSFVNFLGTIITDLAEDELIGYKVKSEITILKD
jgi:hypothetical protein